MTIQVLVTGDIHIGRRPTRVPDVELAEQTSAARMWEAIVRRAIDESVDAVLLSGDIVDHENRFFEATGPLERGILRLAEAEIPTFAVAGNHDWDVFPRILDQLDTPLFHLLGQGGQWEEASLERNGEPVLRIVGWSFPARHVRRNPLAEFPNPTDSKVPTVGLLHADVDVPDSAYAPVRLSDLQTRPIALWVLGHVHKPCYWSNEGDTKVLYPGSPQALRPSETGPHGPWLVEVHGPGSVTCRQIAMSRVRYEERDVDLDGADTTDLFEDRVNDAVTAALTDVAESDEPPELLLLRLGLVGATPLCGRIDELTRPLDDLERFHNGVTARIEKSTNRTRPPINLDELSRRTDPTGTLARLLIALDRNRDDENVAVLMTEATARLRSVHRAPTYAALVHRDPMPDREAARQVLLRQGWRLLETLRAQMPQPQEESA